MRMRLDRAAADLVDRRSVTFDSQTDRFPTTDTLCAAMRDVVVRARGCARLNRARGGMTSSWWSSIEDDAPRVPAGRATVQ